MTWDRDRRFRRLMRVRGAVLGMRVAAFVLLALAELGTVHE